MFRRTLLTLLLTLLLTPPIVALTFPWEFSQLTPSEALSKPAYSFGPSTAPSPRQCKTMPGDADWPSAADWESFNTTLGGVLLKPKPLASVCYYGETYDARTCEQLKRNWADKGLHAADPTSTMSQWASGNSCTPTLFANSTCTQGGWPVYVVNATSVRHVQLAVNFARNRGVRLVVKNTGHDFNGRSIGGGALSVWTRHLRGMAYYGNFSSTSPNSTYTGRAVAYAAGTQTYEGTALMRQHNMTMMVAGGSTVGIAGGWLLGGGHSSYTSLWGLAADNVLQMTAVGADGKVVEMSEGEKGNKREGLWWGMRGGGGGTFAILTSAVVKAFPPTPLILGSIRFSSNDTDAFWAGIAAYLAFSLEVVDAGGIGYWFVYPASNVSALTFTVRISLPHKSQLEYTAFVHPFLDQLAALNLQVPTMRVKRRYAYDHDDYSPPMHNYPKPSLRRRNLGEAAGHTLLTSRLFPRSLFSPYNLLTTISALRHVVEAGYIIHGINNAPPTPSSPSATTPYFYRSVLHAQIYLPGAHWDGLAAVVSSAELSARHDRMQRFVKQWENLGARGMYGNEGDAQDSGGREGMFGENWEALKRVKKQWDPEGVFLVEGGVGREDWDGQGEEGLRTQEGRLCRVRV